MLIERTPDDSFSLFGTDTLLKRLQALTREISGVRESADIEYIHRMRVASRRLRSALSLFEQIFPKKRIVEWNRQIKRITRALGSARDADVQIDFLEKYLSEVTSPAIRPGIERLVLRLQQHRYDQQHDVVEALDRLEKCGVVEDMESTLRTALVDFRLSGTRPVSTFVFEQAYRTISLRLEEMIAYESALEQPACITQHHAMRIAAKRLRYTIEIFEPLYDGTLKASLASVKELQEILGDIHDCDVWVDYLPGFEEAEKQRAIEYFGDDKAFKKLLPGLEYLKEERAAKRQERYKDAVSFWKTQIKTNAWQSLRDMLQEKALNPNLTYTLETSSEEKAPAPEQTGSN